MSIAAPNSSHAGRIWIYLLLTTVISTPFYYLHAYSTTPGAGTYIRWLMWSPAIAALLTLRFSGRDYGFIGWRWPEKRYVVWSCLIPLGYLAATYVIGWMMGGGEFPNHAFIESTRKSFAWRALPGWLVIPIYVVVNGLTRIVTETATALGEEIGWRGFLTPALAERFGFVGTSLITGTIWALWHFPLMFINQPFNADAVFGALCFVGGLTGISFAMTWLRLRSRSVWTAALFHAAHNTFNGFGGSFAVPTARSALLLDETGVVIVGVGAVLAVGFVALNSREAEGVTRPAV